MGSEGPRRALLLGLVEVRQPLDQLDEDGQTRMFALCHTASIAGHVDDTDWLGWHERGLMGVEVALDQDHLQVTSNEVLVGDGNVLPCYQIVGWMHFVLKYCRVARSGDGCALWWSSVVSLNHSVGVLYLLWW